MQLIAVIVVVAALAASVGYGVGSAASPQAADAASASQSTAIVTQLKAINSKLGKTQTSKGSVRGLLTIICDFTADIDCKP